MQEILGVLKLRTLIYFLNCEAEDCSVTKIARTLGEEKYTISRVLMMLEKKGLVDRSNSRKPFLTKEGIKEAKRYAERIEVAMNHLMGEGIDVNSAQKDAFYWALYNSDRSMEIFRAADEQYRVKYEMSGKKHFSGAELCRKMRDGIYEFPFLIYREHIKDGNNISWANEGFEHPCILHVKDGIGTVQLCSKVMTARLPETGEIVKGRAKRLKYFEFGEYVNAEIHGNVLSFPASVLNFINIGSGMGQILHGSVCVMLGSVVGNRQMTDRAAIFTILI